MFYAIDKNTNEFLLSLNIRDRNYKDTYNKELRYICAGTCDNGKDCDDVNVVFVNSEKKQAHFRHSSGSKCSAHRAYIEFNNTFYSGWFKLFNYEYRKPYWYNCKLEQIRDDDKVIMIRYTQQTSKNIKSIENYSQNKIIWILSFENRKYSKIVHYKGKIYVDFIGNKNDIPLYDNNKSVVYLDTGTDILLKVHLNSTSSCYGQEIECINIYDICNEYEYLFIAYPYRKKDTFFRSLIKQQEEYKKEQEIKRKANEKEQIYLLSEYNKATNEYIINKTLENFHKMITIYNKFLIPKPVKQNEEYVEYINELTFDIEDIKCLIPIISEMNKELISEYNMITKLQKISKLKYEYTILFEIIENMKQKYTDITYIEKLVCSNNKYTFNLNLILYNYIELIKLENNIINNILYDEYIRERNILSEEYDWRAISYLEKQHKEYKNKCYNDKQKLIEEEKQQKLAIEDKKVKEKNKKQKERQQNKLLKDKQEAQIEKVFIKNKLEEYSKYNLSNIQLISKLLDDIKDNYSKILKSSTKQSNDLEYLKKYYIYITYPINHDLNKMILYIKKQEEYLQSI
jgi:hypothetical protein